MEMRNEMERTVTRCAGCRKKSCNGCEMAGKFQNGKDKSGIFPKQFVPDKREGYGVAFDVGTTTIAGLLWDLEECCQLRAAVSINPGRVAGSDVLSRVEYALKSPEDQRKMQKMLVGRLDEMAFKMWQQLPEEGRKHRPRRVVIVGNTVMCESILGLSMEALSRAPFQKAYQGVAQKRGEELDFAFLREAQILVLPSIEGYAGADALSVAACVRKQDKRENVLAVDIGTNGEILLFSKEKSYVCTAAAGPALEGAAVLCGMGAVEGAVCQIELLGSFPGEDICCRVIGGGAPKGICGSGLLDALSVLRRGRVLDESGYMRNPKEAEKEGVPRRLCRRLVEYENERAFLLTGEEHPVYLTAKDVRQLQLAKAAIRGGIEILLKKAGIGKKEIEAVYLAGAFGSHISVESAVDIGLLPNLDRGKLIAAGNCAGTGAVMALLSDAFVEEIKSLEKEIALVELAREEDFQECFLKAMEIAPD